MYVLLKEKGMTQRELATKVGATESAVSKYLSGERIPRAEILANIATALDTTVEYLLGTPVRNKTAFGTIYDLCARHASQMTEQERGELITILAKAALTKTE